MSRYYMVLRGRSARARHSSAARGLVADCSGGSRARFGFDAATYREAVSGIERAEQVQVVGFVGYSFGSVRWSYLRGRELRWAVLMRPYPLAATGPADPHRACSRGPVDAPLPGPCAGQPDADGHSCTAGDPLRPAIRTGRARLPPGG